jgi:hypothetical protein
VGIFALNFNTTTPTRPSARRSPIPSTARRSSTLVLGGLATINYTIPPGSTPCRGCWTRSTTTTTTWKAKAALAESTWGTKKVRLALLADDPNFTVTAPALQQSIQDALGLEVELTALPTAPYTELTMNSDDWDIFLSFGGSEGVGWYQSQQYFTCPGLGTEQLKLSEESAPSTTRCSTRPPRPSVTRRWRSSRSSAWRSTTTCRSSTSGSPTTCVYPIAWVVTSRSTNERESFQKILDWTYAD